MELGFKIHGIEIIESSLMQRPVDFIGKSYGFNINAEVRVKPSENLVIVFVDVKISEDHKRDLILGKMKIGVGFVLDNFTDLIKEANSKYNVPQELEINCRMIAISTLRGVLFTHFKGTYLGNILLPLIPGLISPLPEKSASKISKKKK